MYLRWTAVAVNYKISKQELKNSEIISEFLNSIFCFIWRHIFRNYVKQKLFFGIFGRN